MFGIGENKTGDAVTAEKKTTPDEGKTFNKDTVFECVTDCKYKSVRYSRGDRLTGRTCPPHFEVREDLKPKDLEEEKK
jgi:hypothetical protein